MQSSESEGDRPPERNDAKLHSEKVTLYANSNTWLIQTWHFWMMGDRD